MAGDNYWTRRLIGRRTALRGAALAGGGIAALSLVGCGGGSTTKKSESPAAGAAVDSAKGKPGGKFVLQGSAYPGGFVLAASNNAAIAQAAGLTHSGLLEFKNGRPIVDPASLEVDPDLAQAMPEQTPDQLGYVFKLKPANFQNGRRVTSEDVKYSFERYALWEGSAYKAPFAWFDKVETPDPQTAIIRTKTPYADAIASMTGRNDAFILAKEYEESPLAQTKPMGSGAFIFVDTQAPVVTHYRKNPDYFNKPYPYFDELTVLGTTDPSKKISDFISGQVHMTYWHAEEDRDQLKKGRPDALFWSHPAPAHNYYMRVDIPPFNDKRVRQALAMTVNRKTIREGTTKGDGQDDQVLSFTAKAWGFRKPSELGAGAKYWNYDPQAAKQLLSAAGITQPIESSMGHWEANHIGQGIVDMATLAESNWKALGIANLKDVTFSFAQGTTTYATGNYEGLYIYPNGMPINPALGSTLRSNFWSPPEGIKTPTQNTVHVNNPELSTLVDKQLTQVKLEERKQTFRAIEDVLAEEQYRIPLSTYTYNYFGDPTLRNVQMPRDAYNGSLHYIKYWWFA